MTQCVMAIIMQDYKLVSKTSSNTSQVLSRRGLTAACLGLMGMLAFSGIAKAQSFNGSFIATEEEKAKHRVSISRLADVAYACMHREHTRHVNFFKQYKISPFYGSNSAFGKLSVAEKENYLMNRGLHKSILSQMEMTSCVGFALKCFEEGFKAIGQPEVWKRINSYAAQNNYDGSAVIDALRNLGWYVLYWNPDTTKNEIWDAEEKIKDPTNESRIWGYHQYRNITVNKSMQYYKNKIDDKEKLVNFGTRVPRVLREAPLFWGVAHTGFHVFPGARGHVVEAHSTRVLTDFQTVERADFNPLANGGAPRGKYYSGLIAVPPGYEAHMSEVGPIGPTLPGYPDPGTIPGIDAPLNPTLPPTVLPSHVCRIEMIPSDGRYYVTVNGLQHGRRFFARNELTEAIRLKTRLLREGQCVSDPNLRSSECDIRMTVQPSYSGGQDEVFYYVTRAGVSFSGLWKLASAVDQRRQMVAGGECVAKPTYNTQCAIRRTYGDMFIITRSDRSNGTEDPYSISTYDRRYLNQWLSDLVKGGVCSR